MSLKVNFKNYIKKIDIKNFVLFADENFKIMGLKNLPLTEDVVKINKTINYNKLKDKDFLLFNLNPSQKILLVKIKSSKSSLDNEKIGAKFYNFLKNNLINSSTLHENNFNDLKKKNKFFLEEFLHGIKLKSYEFRKYKTKNKNYLYEIDILAKQKSDKKISNNRFNSLIEGITLTKDLVSEPGNVLHPDEYAKRLLQLKKDGLKVTVYDDKKLKNLGMNALLGVGQGSIRGSYLVTIEWKGAKNNKRPVAFVGKGVCFDTGGISLKPAKFMEDMTYDMAGSAVVVGLMKNLALRKAKVNAVGIVGLVENMPGGNAQRP